MEVTAGTRRTLSIAAFALMAMAVASSLEPVAANKDGDALAALRKGHKDSDALAALRKGLKDPDGMLTSWDTSLVNPCTWFHVTCDGDNRVIRLDLGRLSLSGPLAPELGQLEKLQYMEIYGNNINGPIPSEFGDLANLISLDLSSNSISGAIPAALGKAKSLTFLRLGHNHLTGPIPRELDGLPNLGIADFSNNDLCGKIPTGGAFQKIPRSSFANNPRLHQGGKYEPKC